MQVLKRNNGDWCMEHNGTEAPYVVLQEEDGLFSVFDIEDDDFENPVVKNATAMAAARIAAAHFYRSSRENIPPVPQALLDEWQKVKNALARFRAVAHSEQIVCRHSHAVQYNPRESVYGFSDGYSKRCCVACGLVEIAEAKWDPDGFEEHQAIYGAEIMEEFDQGFRFNHYTLPGIVEYEPGHYDARLDALLQQGEDQADEH